MSDDSSVQALLAGMLNKPMFVAIRTPRDLSRLSEVLEAHLLWAIGAQKRGELFVSGPFVADGVKPGELGGMSILRAANEEEAQQLIQRDPFIAEGVFEARITKWLLMEGGVTLNVTFSDQHFSLF